MADKTYIENGKLITIYKKPLVMQIVDKNGKVIKEEKIKRSERPINKGRLGN